MNAPDRFQDVPIDDEVARLRTPPYSREAEQSVLGGLLIDNRAWDLAGDLLDEADFYRHEHRLIFAAIRDLSTANKPSDVVTVHQRLQEVGKGQDVGGLAYLNALAQSVPSAANMRRYAEIVRERSVLRRLIAASDEIATSAFNPQGQTVEAILDQAGARLSAVLETGGTRDDWVALDTLVVDQIDRANAGLEPEAAAHYLPTGFQDIDEMLDGGLRGGNYVVIGARPSMGKTALAHGIAEHCALRLGLAAGVFSMEMQNAENGQRALASSGQVPLHALRRPERLSHEHWERMTGAVDRMRGAPLYYFDRGGLNINQVRARARILRRQCQQKGQKLSLLVLDYLQLMSGTDGRAPRHLQLEEASRGIKSLAKELNIPVVVLVQVNRGVEKETDPMPRMSDIKDCGSIEQDADIILFLHRHWVHKTGLGDEWKPYAQARLAKQRGGRTGELALYYEGQYTRFSGWPRDTPYPTSLAVTKPVPGGGL